MAFPTTTVKDDFNRANETPIGGNWSGPMFTAENPLNLSSNQLAAPGGGGNSYWSASQFGEDSEIFATLTVVPGNANFFNLFARTTNIPTSPTCYMVRWIYNNAGTDTIRVFKRVGSSSQLGADISQDLAVGDRLGLEVTGNSTTTLNVYLSVAGGSWSNIATRTDSTSPITGAGYLGVEWTDNLGRLDDFGGGTVSTGSGAPGDLRLLRSGLRW